VGALLRRLMLAHLAIVNEGSPAADAAFAIADVTLAQALYGRLAAAQADYYRFEVADPTTMRLSMLVPQEHYAAGFRPLVILSGPGLPAEGLHLPAEDKGTRMGTTAYQRTQQAEPRLVPGRYMVEVRSDSSGVYCFCVGTREPDEYADTATRARVHALLATPPEA
jgi:hypothetical protein